jgi:hypothetical protein
MLPTAAVSKTGSITLHTGPAASTVYIVPVTSAQLNPVMDPPVMGLVPTSPVRVDVGILVIPDCDRITKLPADPRFTVEAPITPGIITAAIRQINAMVTTIEESFPALFFVPFIVSLLTWSSLLPAYVTAVHQEDQRYGKTHGEKFLCTLIVSWFYSMMGTFYDNTRNIFFPLLHFLQQWDHPSENTRRRTIP